MIPAPPDLATVPLVLPPDAKLLPVQDLAPRLRARLGPEAAAGVVLTRPGFRVTTRLVPGALAALLGEFRTASLLTDAVLRFSRAHGQDPAEILELSFDALAALVDGRLLVAAASPEAGMPAPSLAAGQAFATLEIEALLRALDDTEVYRARLPGGQAAALKVARDGRAAQALAQEARMLARLGGGDTPRLLAEGNEGGRAWLAMEWRDGVPVSVAAQQARASGDRAGLHRLVLAVLDAYARLHARGVLHGDIHPGNLLVAEGGGVSILDLGQARLAQAAEGIDPARTGIPHFHDPQMAAALLLGAMPPAATAQAEQYALGALAHLLLTGLHPIRPVAERAELLARIAERPPLPFAAQGVAAWPRVEAVLRRALAKAPGDRFAGTADFARAFRAAWRRPAWQQPNPTPAPDGGGSAARHAGPPPPAGPALNAALPAAEPLLDALWPGGAASDGEPAALAWVALRAALAHTDSGLLAVADIWAARAGDDIAACAVAAEVARARSDGPAEAAAVAGFLAAAERVAEHEGTCLALLQAARLFEGAESRAFDAGPLRRWAEWRLGGLLAVPAPDAAALHAALALGEAGALPWPADFRARLDGLAGGSVWLWATAHDAFAEPRHAARALAAARPPEALARGLACLRLHQMTGDGRWVAAARRAAARAAPGLAGTLLAIEIAAPHRMVPPPPRLLRMLAGPRHPMAGQARRGPSAAPATRG